MIKHPERVASIGEARVISGEAYDMIEVDYATEGGISKTLRLAHCEADQLRALLISQLDGMEPERRKFSFFNSLRRKR